MSRVRLVCPDCDHLWYGDGDADAAICPECGGELDLNEHRRQARRAAPEDPPVEVTARQRRPRG